MQPSSNSNKQIPHPPILNLNDATRLYYLYFKKYHWDLSNEDTTCDIISMKDGISMQRLTIPCRGLYCKHLQCFSYESYLHINKGEKVRFLKDPRNKTRQGYYHNKIY